MKKHIVIATRSSKLALWQAEWVKTQIQLNFPKVTVELSLIKTKGDKILDTPLAKIGGKGLFVKELETAMLKNEADIAVHSLKDVPVELPEGLSISVYTKRETPNDAFVSNHYSDFSELPKGAVIGTSSLRRMAQLKKIRPDIEFKSLRGNVITRLSKLDNGDYDAIILAAAGLIRLELKDRITRLLDVDISLPAIGQGVVCIETRTNDEEVMALLAPLKDHETRITVQAERALLCRLNGGCQVPLAGYATLSENTIYLTGLIASLDGKQIIKKSIQGNSKDAHTLGTTLAEDLLKSGGREILESVGIEVAE
ncbi:MAG: hydroxymethylbilane synthase [Deltaproteobacteria bacterium]|jgi:hydroxymethylbilane synthase|nr:hydroxymethylbilane synthase [Deltaproteobacteria bacterium]